MAVVHVVTLTFRPETAESVVSELAAALDELGPQSNATVFQHGTDLHIRDGNADYAINAVFADEEAFLAYMASAQHQRIISDLVMPHLQARSAVQFVDTNTASPPPNA
jgi:stress responsive alpha/beta barrel protein